MGTIKGENLKIKIVKIIARKKMVLIRVKVKNWKIKDRKITFMEGRRITKREGSFVEVGTG